MISAREGLQQLAEGNQRFVTNCPRGHVASDQRRRNQLVDGQSPFAIVLSCSDSRVPPELVFDQSLGDLFTVRVAGNIVAPPQIGSIEFAIAQFETPLVVVLGHTGCGAVSATIADFEQTSQARSSHLNSIIDRVRPAIEPLYRTDLRDNHTALLAEAVRANARASAEQLRQSSDLIRERTQAGTVQIVAAEYALESGIVEFLEPLS